MTLFSEATDQDFRNEKRTNLVNTASPPAPDSDVGDRAGPATAMSCFVSNPLSRTWESSETHKEHVWLFTTLRDRPKSETNLTRLRNWSLERDPCRWSTTTRKSSFSHHPNETNLPSDLPEPVLWGVFSKSLAVQREDSQGQRGRERDPWDHSLLLRGSDRRARALFTQSRGGVCALPTYSRAFGREISTPRYRASERENR